MNALKLHKVLLACIVLIMVCAPASYAMESITIGKIVLEDESPGTLAAIENALQKSFTMQGITMASIGKSTYTINVYHKGTEHSRTFNFLGIFMWPIVGITQSHTTVYVSSDAVDADGKLVWTGGGEASASAWLFSDFYYPSADKLLPIAAGRSVRGVGSLTASTPERIEIQLVAFRF